MPRDIAQIKEFHGGINDASEPSDIADNECQVAQDCDFSVVGKIRTSGSLSNDPATDPPDLGTPVLPGRGLFSYQANRDAEGAVAECTYYVAHNSNVVSVWDSNDAANWDTIIAAGSGDDQWNDSSPSPNYLYYDAVLRICDGDHTHTNNSRMWYGYINRTHFTGATGADAYSGMDTQPADLTTPSGGAIVNNSTTFTTAVVNIDHNSADSGGSIPSATYTLAYSFVYDDNQESLLKTFSGTQPTIGAGNAGMFDAPVLTFHTLNPRISGVRVYCQNQATAENSWHLLIDVDLAKGYRLGLSETYAGSFTGNANEIVLTCGDIVRIGAETYRSINGYEHDEPIDCSYKTAIVLDGVTYAGNYIQNGVQYTDRLIKSNIGTFANQPDVFPESNWTPVGPNDGDSIVKLETYSDRILVFKKRTLYILIYSSELQSEIVESTHPFMGLKHPGHSISTTHGIVFMNDMGVFLYDGQTVKTLTGKMEDLNIVSGFNPTIYENTLPSITTQE